MEPRLRVWDAEHDFNTPVNSTEGLISLCADYITKEMVGCEVGCFKGASTEVFANFSACIHAVDPWTRVIESNYGEVTYDMLTEAEAEFDVLTQQHNNIIKHKLFSSEALGVFQDTSLDYVYIDGAHDYESASFDIFLWRKKIKKGGLLMGHDYSAVAGILEILNLEPVKIYSDESWVVVLSS